MKVTWNWLAEFVELEQSPTALADRLSMAGLEVESVETRGRELQSVRVAEVVSVRPHPQSERLSVCEIRFGKEPTVAVVCGAPNVAAGLRVPYAPPGTRLSDGREIAAAEIRGVHSAGMLCSEAELGLGPDTSGLLVLPADASLDLSLAQLLGVDDLVLDVSITPNRGDCLSVIGLAREIAALTGQALKRPRVNVSESGDSAAELIAIRIADSDLCGRYVGRVITGVSIRPSPLPMQYRLRAVGMRPINNVVDVTNYVMLERGQPLHAFDYDKLARKEIVVRRAGRTASISTLDGQGRSLDADDLVISTGDEVVALAGVMGGANSEVSEDTTRILLESAWFAPTCVRRTAKRIGLRTEASFRFERGVDVDGVATAADLAAKLIAKWSGGAVASGRVDAFPGARTPAPISVRLKRLDELLGMNVPRAEVIAKLKALGMSVSPATRGVISVVPPSYRNDLDREIDVVEEVVRLIGYENVPATVPETTLAGEGLPAVELVYRALRQTLVAQGLNEAVPLSFTSPHLNQTFHGVVSGRQPVTLLNPMSQDDSELRLSLCSSLVRLVRHNLAQGNDGVALFALSKVFWRDSEYREAMHVAGAVCPGFPSRGVGPRAASADFAEIKGVVESLLEQLRLADVEWTPLADEAAFHPGKSARLHVGGHPIGLVGAVHPNVIESLEVADPCWLFELDLAKAVQYCPPRVIFEELPRFPAVRRDIAILADVRFAADEVVRFIRGWQAGAALIEEVHVFDEYAGAPIPAGKKSLAYSVAYRAADRTLTDAEVNEVQAKLIAALTENLQVEPR